MTPLSLAIVGYGKIARDQHHPAIDQHDGFTLSAIASRNGHVDGLPHFESLEALLESDEAIDAVSLCAPPSVRFEQAMAAMRAGKHVMLEKPPGATLSEIEILKAFAERQGVTLFASWHSREAPGVARARAWLADKTVTGMHIEWKEDVTKWHPGQSWIWQAGGLGVFDPGINALSIMTEILPMDVYLHASTLVFPANTQAPIAASLTFKDLGEHTLSAEFDWRQQGDELWNITIETDHGTLALSKGGSQLHIDGEQMLEQDEREYPGLYQRFFELIERGECDVDVRPLRHVADAFMLGERTTVEAFHDPAV
ncbi:Gfo/Idh/MocA family protein [Larsenimonas suaedae]|uniref:Gfo/Idh/MocA family oxidoreductase n=1 Tax=Larsenimonas suaedae TaxID=1851019 RepID=A0ABU1GU59_9GAMM|nr:Gfo/Idh/MocA family oxidoreductase [Larsenimonas suaedae]MCM2972004.1 Gfo/Idh/MocA family oxidoreductase [Larsenimonas suaedae]MDR5895556.1 Gfo/Idh/MocA family oxidoreductase [Larsenimonas suaedae]